MMAAWCGSAGPDRVAVEVLLERLVEERSANRTISKMKDVVRGSVALRAVCVTLPVVPRTMPGMVAALGVCPIAVCPIGANLPGESEVENFDVPVGPEHQVLRLDVPVNDTAGVRHGQGVSNLPSP